MLNAIMLNVTMLNVIILNVIMLNVIMLRVVEPLFSAPLECLSWDFFHTSRIFESVDAPQLNKLLNCNLQFFND
jgi:hypothetical protein